MLPEVTQRLDGDFFQARGYAAHEGINTDQRLADRLETIIKMYSTAKWGIVWLYYIKQNEPNIVLGSGFCIKNN